VLKSKMSTAESFIALGGVLFFEPAISQVRQILPSLFYLLNKI